MLRIEFFLYIYLPYLEQILRIRKFIFMQLVC